MFRETDAQRLLLMTILQEPNAETARRRYIQALGLDDIDDHAIYAEVERVVLNALLRKDSVLEIPRELAQVVLLMLKKGIKKPRGGRRSSPSEKLRKRTLVTLGRGIKAELMAGGMDATNARMDAAEEAAKEGERQGLNYSANYLARKMDKAER